MIPTTKPDPALADLKAAHPDPDGLIAHLGTQHVADLKAAFANAKAKTVGIWENRHGAPNSVWERLFLAAEACGLLREEEPVSEWAPYSSLPATGMVEIAHTLDGQITPFLEVEASTLRRGNGVGDGLSWRRLTQPEPVDRMAVAVEALERIVAMKEPASGYLMRQVAGTALAAIKEPRT